MVVIEKLKIKASNLKKEISAIYYAYQNPSTGIVTKIVIVIALGYALSPIDLIPDFIPIIGYLDDLIIIPALIALSLKLLPEEILDESRKRASQEPVQFKKNWFSALLFILIWSILITGIVVSIVRFYTE